MAEKTLRANEPGVYRSFADPEERAGPGLLLAAKYYDFNIVSHDKAREKLDYMHYNPVKAGLCGEMTDWRWSSAWFYYLGKSVGVRIESGL